MKSGGKIFAVLVLAAVGVAQVAAQPAEAAKAAASAPGGRFMDAKAFDWQGILPAPPAPGTLAARADLETVLQVQESRTAEQIAWAKAVVHDEVFRNAQVLGAWFTPRNLPATAEFFREVNEEARAVEHGLKGKYQRKRPPFTDGRVHPCIAFEPSDSYPSGHSMRTWIWAELLAEIFPERRAELGERARAVMWGRVIGGVHFPTDTIGGQIVGQAVAREMLKNPAVRAAIERCRAEAAPYLLKKAA